MQRFSILNDMIQLLNINDKLMAIEVIDNSSSSPDGDEIEPYAPNPELRVDKRVLILGTNSSGAFNLTQIAQEYFDRIGMGIKVDKIREPELIQMGFFGVTPKKFQKMRTEGVPPEFTLPLLVVAFPEMRAVEESSNAGTTVSTPIGFITNLCAAYNVPLKCFDSYDVSPNDFIQEIVGALPAVIE